MPMELRTAADISAQAVMHEQVIEMIDGIISILEPQQDGIMNEVCRDLWRARTLLATHESLLNVAAASCDDDERIVALKKLSVCADEKVIPTVARIASNPATPPRVADVAKQALEEIPRRSKEEFAAQIVEQVGTRLTERIEELILGQDLQNYEGFLCVAVADADGHPCALEEAGGVRLSPGQEYCISVRFQPKKPTDTIAESVVIRDGVNAPEVVFDVFLDSEGIELSSHDDSLAFCPGEQSRLARFPFSTPNEIGEHEVWVQVFQRTRLIQSVRVSISVITS
jgi:hypothetical protein